MADTQHREHSNGDGPTVGPAPGGNPWAPPSRPPSVLGPTGIGEGHDQTGQIGRDQTVSFAHEPTSQWAVDRTRLLPPTSADHWGYQHLQAGPPAAPTTTSGAQPQLPPPHAPWQPGPAGWGPPEHQWGPPGPPSLSPAPAPPPPVVPNAPAALRPTRRPGLLAAGFVATAVVFGGAGLGVGLAVAGDHGNPPRHGVTLPTAAKTPPNGGAPFNVGAIARRVDRATVDITADDPGGGQDEGTGMILTSSGIVLTNNHVVDGSTQLSAQVDGAGRSYSATVLGVDPSDDVAVLQLHGGRNFKTVVVGDSSAVSVGDQVVAIGNALALPGPETVTSGTISATGRPVNVSDPSSGLQENLKGLFQTTAPINPGNSGGPLVDAAGQVIGMNTASAQTPGSGAASNIGFAIPINGAMSIARQVLSGKATANIIIGQRAIMGVDVVSVACAEGDGQGCPGGENPFNNFPFGGAYTPPVTTGAVVVTANQASPAQLAGLGFGDVIVSVDRSPVKTVGALTNSLKKFKVGQEVSVAWVDPRGKSHKAAIKLTAGPTL